MLTQERQDCRLPQVDLATPRLDLNADWSLIKCQLNCMPAVDIGDHIARLPVKEQAIAFRLLNKNQATAVFEYLPSEVQQTLIDSLQASQVQQIVESMSPDDRAELFDELPARVVRRLVRRLSPAEREATALLLGYPENSAGRVMTTEYVRLRQGLTVDESLNQIRRSDRDKETIYYAYVTDHERVLRQVVSLRQLLFAAPDDLIEDIASDQVISARTEMHKAEVAQLMKRYDLLAMPVVDREGRLVGIVTFDDMVDILEEEATEDIHRLAGASGDEQALSAPLVTVRKRLPWLVGNIGLYIAAASAIAPFQTVISAVPVLAVIMPILSNTSGNVAIQALSVTVRGLGVGEVTPRDTPKILRKEVLAGLATALALGILLGFLSLIWSTPETRWVAVIAALVMALNVLVAASVGTLLPVGLKRLNLDPALISGPLLTTILDAIGFVTFLSLITIVLKFL